MPDLQPHSRAMGQKDGKKWTAAADLQPTISKSDSLLEHPAKPGQIHTGPQLDQADLDVWEQCLHLARTGGLGTRIQFTAGGFLN
ncbi:MAG: hypothetical protein WAW68_06085 [Rhodoferax sp.]